MGWSDDNKSADCVIHDGLAIKARSEGFRAATPLVTHEPETRIAERCQPSDMDFAHQSKYFGSKLTPDFFKSISNSSRKPRVR